MNATAAEPLFELFAYAQAETSRCGTAPRPTLEDRISRAWNGLLARGSADCPVCHGPMERAGSTGHCTRCGTTLS